MVLIQQILALFGTTSEVLSGEETFRDAVWALKVSPWQLPAAAALSEALSRIPSRDNLHVTLKIDGGTSLLLNPASEPKIEEFIRNAAIYYELENGRNVLEINLKITKHFESGSLSFYSLSHFEGSLQKLNAKQLFAAFEPVCSGSNSCCIILPQTATEFQTETLAFTHVQLPGAATKRDELIIARKDICHFEGSQRRFLPEDFHLNKPSSSTNLNYLFDRLCLIATLTFISDISSLENDGTFTFKLNGYRAITGDIQCQTVSTALLQELYKVYRWAYLDGNTSDKLGLARNIISLHFKGDAAVAPDAGIYDSILSG